MAETGTTRKKTTRRRVASKKTQNGTLKSFNPRTGEVMREIATTPVGDVKEIVAQARKVQSEWAAIDPAGRGRYLREVAHNMYDRLDDISAVVSAEAGKSRHEAFLFDGIGAINLITYMSRLADKALRPEKVGRIAGPLLYGSRSHIEWRPYGVVGAITPWNYPITNCLLSFIGALLAGNTVVVKPSEVTPASGELVGELFDPLPSGVFTIIQGGGEVGAALVDAPCDKIAFIGSAPTGRKICEAAAKHLTPVVMELGGQDAAVVCDDADLEVASSGIVWGSFFNAGQTCCSVERVFVNERIADDFERMVVEKASRIELGAGDQEMGSLTFAKQLDIVTRHVDDAISKGARVLVGGPDAGIENKNGTLWYAPTVLSNVTTDMDVVNEETFGPVVTITRVQDDDEAIRRSNEEGVNLTASVWTKDRRKADTILKQLRAGALGANDHGVLPGYAWAPWGGAGESGFGRLNGVIGIREMAIPTHVAHALSPSMKKPIWYPYDRSQEVVLRGIAKVMAARDWGTKLEGIGEVVANFPKVLKSRL
ncbi:MAG TPA: aldehyde dehydrogenase family protein [Actinomycetota bacterium]|nr:aldehyde dehydrogenase family protein [Actinomycetota bacterium]